MMWPSLYRVSARWRGLASVLLLAACSGSTSSSGSTDSVGGTDSGTAGSVADGNAGRYVRISVPDDFTYMSVAEVEVEVGGVNVALDGTATQSSEHATFVGPAARGVDGNADGEWSAQSVTHTDQELGPWWEVDLGSTERVDTIRVHNRTDCCGDRLENHCVSLLDDARTTVWRVCGNPAPDPVVSYPVPAP